MGKIFEFSQQLVPISGEPTPAPLDVEAIKQALIKKIEQFDIDGVTVENVEVDEHGIMVTFMDYEQDEIDVYFMQDDNEGSIALILGEEEDNDYLLVDLGPLSPTLINHGQTQYLNMTELSWLNKSALAAIFMAGSIGDDDAPEDAVDFEDEMDDEGERDFGWFKAIESFAIGEDSEIEELFASVVRGGKKVKLAIVKKVRRKRLSATKRMGIRSAVRKRKTHASRTARKVKRSIKVRKRLNLKKHNYGKFRKISGTANRKR